MKYKTTYVGLSNSYNPLMELAELLNKEQPDGYTITADHTGSYLVVLEFKENSDG